MFFSIAWNTRQCNKDFLHLTITIKMKLSEIAKASKASAQTNHAVLIYSRPKLGKTRLAGTAAKIPEIKRIFWFDLENGAETLLNMDLTEEELDKVTLFKLVDTRESPVGIETMLKAFSMKSKIQICDKHGRVNCAECAKNKDSVTPFALAECTHNDLVVVDSGSQLADSALGATMLGKESMAKPGWDEYGIQGKWLGDILSVIQQASNTNFVVLTHELVIEEDINDVKKDVIYPLMGTKAFSMKVAKYFGTVVYLHKKMGKHAAASSSTFRNDVITGSRLNIAMEGEKDADMHTILVKGGILKTRDESTAPKEQGTSTAVPQKTEEPAAKPLTLAQRMAMKK